MVTVDALRGWSLQGMLCAVGLVACAGDAGRPPTAAAPASSVPTVAVPAAAPVASAPNAGPSREPAAPSGPQPTKGQLTCVNGVLPAFPVPKPTDEPQLGHGAGMGTGGAWDTPAIAVLVGVPSVTGLRGRAIAEGACKAVPAIRQCYLLAPDKTRGLKGSLDIALLIDDGGKVTSAKRAGGTIDQRAFNDCAERFLGEATFPAAARGAATYTLTARGPRPTTESNVEVTGGLPPEVVKRIVRVSFPALRDCRAAADGDDGPAKLSVSFTVADTGAVTDAAVTGSTVKDDKERACMVAAVKALSFPQPDGGTVKVKASIHFAGD